MKKLIHPLYQLLLLLPLINQLFGTEQDSTLKIVNLEGYPIRNVRIFGNEVTRDEIILREIHLKKDSILTWKQINRDKERLENLQIFSSIAIYPVDQGDSVDLHILLQERKRWLFFPIVFYDEQNGWMYGAGGVNSNFRGRDEMLYLNMAIGGEIYLQLWFNDPWVIGDHISLDAQLIINAFRNTYEDFYQNEKSLRFSMGGWISDNRKWNISSGYIEVSSDLDGKTISLDNVDRNPFISATYLFDYRDLYVNTTSGSYLGLTGEMLIPTGAGKLSKVSFISDLRYFLPLTNRMRLAFWNVIDLSAGRIPEYRYVHLGGSNTLRGWSLNSMKGKSAWYSSVEARYDVLPKRILTKGIDIGIGGLVFIDGGTAFNTIRQLGGKKFLLSAGIGFRVFFPIVQEVRFAWGKQINGKGDGFTFNTSTRF